MQKARSPGGRGCVLRSRAESAVPRWQGLRAPVAARALGVSLVWPALVGGGRRSMGERRRVSPAKTALPTACGPFPPENPKAA